MEVDWIAAHLTLKGHQTRDGISESSLTRALIDCRRITGRNEDTGVPINEHSDLGNWLGAIGYFMILDQVGACYRPQNKDTSNERRAVIKALEYFTDIAEEERFALYALRCSLTHDYSLVNIPNNQDRHLMRIFTVDNSNENWFVILPEEDWDGNFSHRNNKNVTKVNLRELGNTVEKIYSTLIESHQSQRLIVEDLAKLQQYIWFHP